MGEHGNSMIRNMNDIKGIKVKDDEGQLYI